jgi:hypothetical protein
MQSVASFFFLLLFSPLVTAAGTTTPMAHRDTILLTFHVYLYGDSLTAANFSSTAAQAAMAPSLAARGAAVLYANVTFDTEAPPVAVAACTPGTSFLNGTECAPCDGCVGEYRLAWCAGRTDTSCVSTCPPGSYAHHGGAPVYSLGGCTWCGPGRYTSRGGETECATCPIGSFSGGIGATGCVHCAMGTNTSSTGASACTKVRPAVAPICTI